MVNQFSNKPQNVPFKNDLFSLLKQIHRRTMFLQNIKFQLASSGNLLHQELTSFVIDSIKEGAQRENPVTDLLLLFALIHSFTFMDRKCKIHIPTASQSQCNLFGSYFKLVLLAPCIRPEGDCQQSSLRVFLF